MHNDCPYCAPDEACAMHQGKGVWKNELVTIRVTPAQKAAYMALAASKGMSLSELIRERLEAGEPSAESAAAPAATPPRPSPASSREVRPDPKTK